MPNRNTWKYTLMVLFGLIIVLLFVILSLPGGSGFDSLKRDNDATATWLYCYGASRV